MLCVTVSRLGGRGLGALLKHEGELALAAVLTVLVPGHKDAGTALGRGALATEALDVAIAVDLVVPEDGHLDLLALVGDALGGGVNLLLALLGTTTQAEHQVEGRLLLDVVVDQGAAILELLASKAEALLGRRDALLVLGIGLVGVVGL